MRLVLGAAIAVIMMTGAALAQTEGAATTPPPAVQATSQCAPTPAAPTPPDGATASRDDINAFNTAYQTYGAAVTAALQCRRTELTQIQATTQSLLDQHNALAQTMNGLTTAWTAETQEFCARRGNRCEAPPAQ